MKFLRLAMLAAVVVALGAGTALANPSSSSCLGCHSGFVDRGDLHDAHTAFINSCTYCHVSVGDTPPTGSSGQDENNGCSGCHSAGGTSQHHITTAASGCGCHADPGDWPRGLESDTPPYYGTAATSLTDPCDDNLDNDGDDLYDAADGDCTQTPVRDSSWSVIKEAYGS